MSAFVNKGDTACMSLLSSLGIAAPAVTHDAVKTVDEWRAASAALPASTLLAKNMFLKGKKGELVLVTSLADTATDLKAVCKVTGAGSGNLRFAAEDVLNSTLGVVQGAVTPLALVNDAAKAVTVVLDSALVASSAPIAFHPCRNDQSVCLTAEELQKVFKHLGYEPKVVDFAAEAAAAAAAPAAKKPALEVAAAAAANVAGETKLGMNAKKMERFADWYGQVITKAEMIEFYDVSGCYILRPWAFAIWEHIQKFFDEKIKELGVENAYFPMFVSKAALEREESHIEGFAPEAAWVTKAGDNDLAEHIAIRPTSETVISPNFAKWIRSYRDLPVKINQWCSVVRWEFSNPTPFIRSREFLWQEGHTAHATKDEADVEVRQILDLYRRVYEDLLAVPCEPGMKTEKEKFAGGFYTTTVETLIPAVGRGCQGATSHCLGQSFGKMFNIEFEDPAKSDGSKLIPWQNSWGLTTRTIGVMTMVHGDDRGLVLPPRVARFQVVVVPVGVTVAMAEDEKKKIYAAALEVAKVLKAAGVRTKEDVRDNYTPGWKFNFWELKGVPLRIEVGPNEIANAKLSGVRRFDGKRVDFALDATTGAAVAAHLEAIQAEMLDNARKQRAAQVKQLTQWTEFVPTLNQKCVITAPWCGETACEDAIKTDSAEEAKALSGEETDERAPSMGAKSLCIPFNQPELPAGTKCICKGCTKDATQWVLFGRSY